MRGLIHSAGLSAAARLLARAVVAAGVVQLDACCMHGPRKRGGGVGPNGEVSGVTTTSGLAFKIPGRVGDSPILGAGLSVDGDVGAAGSTGRGEANLNGLASFFIVDEMRRRAGAASRTKGSMT